MGAVVGGATGGNGQVGVVRSGSTGGGAVVSLFDGS